MDRLTAYATTGSISDSALLSYDANGNRSTSSHGQTVYVHDSRNRLTSMGTYAPGVGWSPAVGSSFQSWLFQYDADGRRILKSSSTAPDLSFVHAGDMA